MFFCGLSTCRWYVITPPTTTGLFINFSKWIVNNWIPWLSETKWEKNPGWNRDTNEFSDKKSVREKNNISV